MKPFSRVKKLTASVPSNTTFSNNTLLCGDVFRRKLLRRQQGIEAGPSCRGATVLITAPYKCVGNITLDVCARVCVLAFACDDVCDSG